MSDTSRLIHPEQLQQIYTQLSQQDIEQFFAGYQLWNLRKQLATLQEQAVNLQQQIAENAESMQQNHPSPIALATLARFQASGVTDVDLLERMLERGEEWLDRTMQHLDYCEQFNFISYDYTQWCENALEGAFDWIDSIQETNSPPVTSKSLPDSTSETLAPATEELLLQKLSAEESDEQPETVLEITLKQQAIPRNISELTNTVQVQPGSADTPSLTNPSIAMPEERFEPEVNATPDFSKQLISDQENSESEPKASVERPEVEVQPVPEFSHEQLSLEEAAELSTDENSLALAAENSQATAAVSSELHSVPEDERPVIQAHEKRETFLVEAANTPVVASLWPNTEASARQVEADRTTMQPDRTQQGIQSHQKPPFLQRLAVSLVKLITG